MLKFIWAGWVVLWLGFVVGLAQAGMSYAGGGPLLLPWETFGGLVAIIVLAINTPATIVYGFWSILR